MIRAMLLSCVFGTFLLGGVVAPFVFSLGYVWISIFHPQGVDDIIMATLPISTVMGVAAIGSYLIADRRKPPRVTLGIVLTLALATWVTTTLAWAVVPDDAWVKWDWAFKTLIFTAFMPFVFRSRVQIEAFLQVYMFSLLIYFVPFGIKTAISGGGYGRDLGVMEGNSGITEGSTLAAVSLMAVPIILYLRSHSVLLPKSRFTDVLYFGLAAAAVVAAIGTYERTALVGMVVVGVGLLLRSRHKLLYGSLGMIAAAAIVIFSSQAWNQRISTIDDYNQEASALGRILVWQWTLGYVTDHPLGGGFNAYKISHIEMPDENADGQPREIVGKAFHSIYFEVLGEHGWIGLALFLGIIIATLLGQQRVLLATRSVPELQWCNDLARALQIAFVALLACGLFIGIAFQPMIYYIVAITTSLNHCVRTASPFNPGGQEPSRRNSWMSSSQRMAGRQLRSS